MACRRLGWVLAAEAHGKGYASEALAAICAWGRGHFGEHRCACIIAPENAASIRVAAKAGFRLSGRTTYHDEPDPDLRPLMRDGRQTVWNFA